MDFKFISIPELYDDVLDAVKVNNDRYFIKENKDNFTKIAKYFKSYNSRINIEIDSPSIRLKTYTPSNYMIAIFKEVHEIPISSSKTINIVNRKGLNLIDNKNHVIVTSDLIYKFISSQLIDEVTSIFLPDFEELVSNL